MQNLLRSNFYSHAPRGARLSALSPWIVPSISTHTPLAGRDDVGISAVTVVGDISTHTPLAGRDDSPPRILLLCRISTHTPLAGRDLNLKKSKIFSKISTHTPLAGRDGAERRHIRSTAEFLLTRPSRGATAVANLTLAVPKFLLTRPSRGATTDQYIVWAEDGDFYSHAPRGARPPDGSTADADRGFLLTRPSRGATRCIT